MRACLRSRILKRSALAVASAVAAMVLPVNHSCGLTINQWTGNAGDGIWGNLNNWLNGNVPNSTEQATVFNGSIQLNANPPSVGAVLLSHVGSSALVDTNGFKLNVLGTMSLAGGVLDAGIAPAGATSLQASALTITNAGELYMTASTSRVHISNSSSGTANGTLSVDSTSYVIADGILDTGTFTNNGYLGASGNSNINASTFTLVGSSTQQAGIYPGGTVMTINSPAIQLHDYNSTINLLTANSTLNLTGGIDYSSGYIGADISVGDTSNLAFASGGSASGIIGYFTKSGSTFIPHGNVTLTGGPTLARAAQITGEVAFETDVNVTGFASLPNGPEFDGASSATVAANSYLYLNSPYFRGTATSSSITFSGPGSIIMNGATVIGYSGAPYTTVNINANTGFDWDGSSESNASCSISNGELDIYSSTIDLSHTIIPNPPGYYGALTVNGGATLNVAGTAWTLFGTITLGPGAIVQGQALTIDGSNLAPGSYSLTPSYNGTTFPVIQAPVVLNPNSTIYMGPTGGLHLDGATNYAGGSVISAPFISGNQPDGILVQDGNATVSANTTIFCQVLDMDGTSNTATWTINPGFTLTQQAFFLDAAFSTINPFHSTMTLNGGTVNMQTSAGVWTLVGGTINMNQSGFNVPDVVGAMLVLGSGAAIGTINVGASSLAVISSRLRSAATTVGTGNVLSVAAASTLYVNTFSSDANAILTKTGPGKLSIVGTQNHSTGSQIIVSQGELDVNTDAGAGGANLNLNASAGLTNLYGTQHLATLTIATGALVSVPAQVSPSPRAVLVTTLNMSGGTLDLTSNDAICHNASLANIFTNLQTGYNHGTWTGIGGITSSIAAADNGHLHALGSVLNKGLVNLALYPTFDNQTSTTTDVLIKYTYYGDTNLDGKVDGSDYSRIDTAYAAHGILTGWYNGDFNYDGTIDGSDYTLIDNAFNTQGAQTSATLAAQVVASPGISAVPEPASTLVLLSGIAMLSTRRHQRHWR